MSRAGVAPFAGAWIEIRMKYILPELKQSLPSRERGLKCNLVYNIQHIFGRSLRGSVD